MSNKVDVLLGLQWGDEGKGKLVDVLTPRYDIIARFQGGPNAGHTLEFEGTKHVSHTIPSGIFHAHVINLIGNGVVIDPVIFCKELDGLDHRQVCLLGHEQSLGVIHLTMIQAIQFLAENNRVDVLTPRYDIIARFQGGPNAGHTLEFEGT
ncbi:MAG: adenylosuccinate synthetase, partial [Flavobacteriales bacterium]